MKFIKLSQDKRVLVDNEDFNKYNQDKWHYHKGYACKTLKTGHILMHRLIINAPKGLEVDHINRNKLDNRKNNLRIVTHQQNHFNKDLQSNNTSGIKGVYWNKQTNKWRVSLFLKGKRINLGQYSNFQGAFLARKWGERIYFDFSRP